MRNQFPNWGAFYQKISLIFHSIIGLTLLPFAWVYLELEQRTRMPLLVLDYPYVIYVGAGLMVGILLFKTYQNTKESIVAINPKLRIQEKLNLYYEISVRHYFILGMCSLICLVLTFLLQGYFFAIYYIFILFLFSLHRPRYDQIIKRLKLTDKETEILNSGQME
jgi:hypothetical protein